MEPGLRFTHLKTICLKSRGKHHKWECICDCGKVVVVQKYNLISGNSKSCGCMKNALISIKNSTHKMSHSKEWVSFTGMRTRCLNPKNNRYQYYGGRGIRVCKRWDKFSLFYKDMGPKPTPNHSIDRIDRDKDYMPSNCRWATRQEQARNKSNNVFISIDDKNLCISAWAEMMNIKASIISKRLSRGWSNKQAVYGK